MQCRVAIIASMASTPPRKASNDWFSRRRKSTACPRAASSPPSAPRPICGNFQPWRAGNILNFFHSRFVPPQMGKFGKSLAKNPNKMRINHLTNLRSQRSHGNAISRVCSDFQFQTPNAQQELCNQLVLVCPTEALVILFSFIPS